MTNLSGRVAARSASSCRPALAGERRTFDDIRRFLSTCEYVSDPVQFGRADYWLPPEEFERRRRGDCEDFALWTWRQVMALGYSARFVCGHAGRYGGGHAWVTFERDGRTFIVEGLAARFGSRFPRLSTLRYLPRVSLSWDGAVLRYRRASGSEAELRRLVALEADCCAFLNFVIEPSGHELRLTVTGPAKAVPLIHEGWGTD